MKIFLNPGHGGNDTGACGHGLIERDVALLIAQRVQHYLQAVGYQTLLFQFDGLQTICDKANSWGADLFVSIHCNAANGLAQGAETYYFTDSRAGYKLANLIQRQLINSLPLVDRGIKTKLSGGYDIFVCKHTAMPAVLVETAFIDNAHDAQLLRNNQDDFARAIARGISDFYAVDRPPPDVIDRH